MKTSFLISQLNFSGGVENDKTRELRSGITRIASHILGGKYSRLYAKEDASKVACIASLIKDDRLDINVNTLKQHRNNLDKIKDISLPEEFNILNKLKKESPASFYLWAIAAKVI